MKKLCLLMPLLAVLFSCNDHAATVTSGSTLTDSTGQKPSGTATDSANASSSTSNDASAFPAVKPGDIIEDVIPPDESDSLKFGYITKWVGQNGQLFIYADYMQFYYGERAVEEARKRKDAEMDIRDGDTSYSIPSDVYMLNENKRIRQLPVANDVHCFTIAAGDGKMVLQLTNLERLRKRWDPSRIYILILNKDNVVAAIKEQYLP